MATYSELYGLWHESGLKNRVIVAAIIAANTDVGVTSSGAVNHTVTLNGYTAP